MSPAGPAPRLASWASLGGFGTLLLPKCPLCLAAYGGGLTALGLGPGAQRLLEPLLAAAVLVSFGLVLVLSVRRRDVATPLLSALGAVLVLGVPPLRTAGALLLVVAALVNGVLCRRALDGGRA